MKRQLMFLSVPAIAILLSSCSSFDSGGANGGETINNPTVQEMTRLESQWGFQPRQVRAKQRSLDTVDMNSPVTISPAPAPQQPAMLAPAPESLPTTAPAAPQPIPQNLR